MTYRGTPPNDFQPCSAVEVRKDSPQAKGYEKFGLDSLAHPRADRSQFGIPF